MSRSLGFAPFLEQAGGVGHLVLAALMLMSIATWYLIALKLWQSQTLRAHGRTFLRRFRQASGLADAENLLNDALPDNPFRRIWVEALAACHQAKMPAARRAFDLNSPDDFVAAALQRAIAIEALQFEQGMPVLASVASTAPFIGLFGTVWGIYHALVAIGLSGQASLDKVAGPVGEALIMTACGLVVAIPAVLAYNGFAREIRHRTGELERFAQDAFGLLATGRFGPPTEASGNVLTLATHGTGGR